MVSEEPISVRRLAIQHHIDVGVTRLPRVTKEYSRLFFVFRRDRITEPVQCLPEGKPPILIPLGITSGIAAAVAIPAFDSMGTAPRAAFPDFDFEGRRMLFQIFAIVGQPGQ